MAIAKQEKKPKVVQSADLVTFYANGARIVTSEYEARIYFSDQTPPHAADPSGQSTATERVCVIMAPKFVGRLYNQIYEAYHADFDAGVFDEDAENA